MVLLPLCRAQGRTCHRFVTEFQTSHGELGSDLEFSPAGKLIPPPSADVWIICQQPQQICSPQEALGSAREQRVTPGHGRDGAVGLEKLLVPPVLQETVPGMELRVGVVLVPPTLQETIPAHPAGASSPPRGFGPSA